MTLRIAYGAAALAITALVVASASGAGAADAAPRSVCKTNYSYAGAAAAKARYGIRARITNVREPHVLTGHVAGWVGVGGPGLGPNGTDEWLQAGYAALEDGPEQIYYEVTLPGKPTTYHTIKPTLSPRETHLLTVLETNNKRGSWRVWLDNTPVSPVITLPRSHGRFVPQAIGEHWNSGTRQCNGYGYTFGQVRVSRAPGGAWVPNGNAGYVWRDRQNQTIKLSRDSFEVRSATYPSSRRPTPAASANEPPLLGSLASRLASRKLTAQCVRQRAQVRERAEGHLLVSETLCQRLLGYAVAQPYGPAADTGAGFLVVATALDFLRGLAVVAREPPARRDCQAVGWFYRALHVLGATPNEALALRTTLLRRRAQLRQKLSFHPDCRFR